jgi:hypothetical protein
MLTGLARLAPVEPYFSNFRLAPENSQAGFSIVAQVVMFHSGEPGDRRGGQLTAAGQVSRWVPSWP